MSWQLAGPSALCETGVTLQGGKSVVRLQSRGGWQQSSSTESVTPQGQLCPPARVSQVITTRTADPQLPGLFAALHGEWASPKLPSRR